MYAEPSKLVNAKSLVREFPHDRLNFKERIGVGQFGEVWICEATGLDEIYGQVRGGHFSFRVTAPG